MKYTEEQLLQNYNKFLSLLQSLFSGDRVSRLLTMYDDKNLGYRAAFAPASSKEQYHSAYPGGYLDHVNNVFKAAIGTKKLWEVMGGVIDFTDEELAFAAVNHDLGKLGDKDGGEYYLPQDNEWMLKNRGEIYKINTDLQYMTVADRSLFTLQQYGLILTQKEWLAIKLSQGLYEDANKPYMVSYTTDNALKTNLARIIQEADYIACRTECDKFKIEND